MPGITIMPITKVSAMTFEPTPAEVLALRLAEKQLIRMGIPAGVDGYDLDTLAVAIYSLGGAYAIDRQGGSYFAEIRPQQPLQVVPRGDGVGWSAESALIFALVQAAH